MTVKDRIANDRHLLVKVSSLFLGCLWGVHELICVCKPMLNDREISHDIYIESVEQIERVYRL